MTPDGIRLAIDGSLERLQTDYVDLYQLHWPQRPVQLRGKMNYDERVRKPDNQYVDEMIDVLRVLDELIKAGKIRHVGLSNETPRGVMKRLDLAKEHNLPRMQSIQNVYNLNHRQYEV